jgi:TM2 domain-containing membrane protein YozV
VILVRSAKSPGLAAVCSFFWCGLGQIYNGQIGKGLLLGFLHFISILLMFLLIGLITTPILWVYGMVDAYKTAERMNREQELAPPGVSQAAFSATSAPAISAVCPACGYQNSSSRQSCKNCRTPLSG